MSALPMAGLVTSPGAYFVVLGTVSCISTTSRNAFAALASALGSAPSSSLSETFDGERGRRGRKICRSVPRISTRVPLMRSRSRRNTALVGRSRLTTKTPTRDPNWSKVTQKFYQYPYNIKQLKQKILVEKVDATEYIQTDHYRNIVLMKSLFWNP